MLRNLIIMDAMVDYPLMLLNTFVIMVSLLKINILILPKTMIALTLGIWLKDLLLSVATTSLQMMNKLLNYC